MIKSISDYESIIESQQVVIEKMSMGLIGISEYVLCASIDDDTSFIMRDIARQTLKEVEGV